MTWGKHSSATLNARHKPKKCELCGGEFIPLSGRAKRCEKCRRKRLSHGE